MSISYRNS